MAGTTSGPESGAPGSGPSPPFPFADRQHAGNEAAQPSSSPGRRQGWGYFWRSDPKTNPGEEKMTGAMPGPGMGPHGPGPFPPGAGGHPPFPFPGGKHPGNEAGPPDSAPDKKHGRGFFGRPDMKADKEKAPETPPQTTSPPAAEAPPGDEASAGQEHSKHRDRWAKKWKTATPPEGENSDSKALKIPDDQAGGEIAQEDHFRGRRRGGFPFFGNRGMRGKEGEEGPFGDPNEPFPFRGGRPPFRSYRYAFFGYRESQDGPESRYIFKEFDFL